MAESILEMIFRTKKTGDGEKQAESGLSNLNTKFQDLTGVSLTGAGAVLAVGAALKFSVDQAAESEVVTAQLNAVLKSTGMAAGMTTDDIGGMAEELSELTGVEDDSIAKASAVMLTFTKIGKEVFPEAMTAAMNVSAALGQDLQSSVVQLGKALNDPVQGITALSRVGVSFTQEQKAMIQAMVDTGDVLGAQKVILGELNTEFGGAAEAMGSTYSGAVNRLKNAFGNLGESIGAQLLPVLTPAVEALAKLVSNTANATKWVEDTAQSAVTAASSYDVYREGLEKVANEHLMVIDQFGNLRTRSGALVETNFLLSETQFEAARAAKQWSSDTREAALAAQHAEGAANKYAKSLDEVEAEEREAKKAAEEYERAHDRLKDAVKDSEKALANWSKNAGEDLAGQMEEAGIKGDMLAQAFGAIDEVMGTGLVVQQAYKDDQAKLIEAYQKTGDLDTFKRGLRELRDTYGPLDDAVIRSKEKVEEFQKALQNLPATKEILIHIKALVDIVQPGGGGDEDGGCFVAGTLVATPAGERRIEEVQVGETVALLGQYGALKTAVVKRLTRARRRDLVEVRLSTGRVLRGSPNHPFLTVDFDWLWMRDLAPGMWLEGTEPARVEAVERYPGMHAVYNFEIDAAEHTYLVEGCVAHNANKDIAGLNTLAVAGGPSAGSTTAAAASGTGAGVKLENLIGVVNINNGMDLEELVSAVATRLNGRI